MGKKAAKNPAKTAGKSAHVKLIPQPKGGALLAGGVPGNVGGTGRPPSEIRKRLRGDFDRRRKILREIADDGKLSPADRLKAIDLMAKYGLGAIRELTTEHVRERLVKQIAIIRQELPPEVAEPLLTRLGEVWS